MFATCSITAANDVSSRKAQFSQSQWSYSKGFDGACPIGPTIVHIDAIKHRLADIQIQAKLNDTVVQQSNLADLIFSIPKIVSFLSQGTTLPAGTLILTGYVQNPATNTARASITRELYVPIRLQHI